MSWDGVFTYLFHTHELSRHVAGPIVLWGLYLFHTYELSCHVVGAFICRDMMSHLVMNL